MLLTSLIAIAALATAAPTTRSSSTVDACTRSPNCETYQHPVFNRTLIRFKEGMGPDSDWYHENVRLKDPFHPMNQHRRHLMTRQDQTVTYNLERNSETISYGDFDPVNGPGSTEDNCGATNCLQVSYSVPVADYINDASYTTCAVQTNVNFDADGQWDGADQRDYYVQALAAIAGATRTNPGRCQQGPADGGYEYDFTHFEGPSHINVNRYIGSDPDTAALQGFLGYDATFTSADGELCSDVFSGLSAAAGAVDGIAGGFFGLFSEGICDGSTSSS